MNKIEDMIQESKLYEMIRKRDDDKMKKTLLCILGIIGAVAAIALIAYAVYRFFTPDYLEDFEEDFDDDFEDMFDDEEVDGDEEVAANREYVKIDPSKMAAETCEE